MDSHSWAAALRSQIPTDAVAMGVLQTQSPSLDELLVADGWPGPELAAWFQVGYQGDRLLRTALRAGLATGEAGRPEAASALLPSGHGLGLALSGPPSQKRCWWLFLSRAVSAFTTQEQQLAHLALRRCQARFHQPQEHGLARLILGRDRRLVLADLGTQEHLLREPAVLDALREEFGPVLGQRYPDLADLRTCDLVLRLKGQPVWACFRRRRAADLPAAEQWYVELRPLEADDMPPLGLLPDDRVARAMAFIHDHYAESSSLGDIARTVHVSPFHFHRLFSRLVGVSPKQYLQKKQLQVAKWLLRRPDVPIGQVAKLTGFSSHGHFSSTFHRIVGMAPSTYRERNLASDAGEAIAWARANG